MDITSIRTNAASNPQTQSPSSDKSTLGYDTFLRLLIEQMKNQDPTAPMKSTEYMGQLAVFSQVEQSVATNAKLDALLASASLSQANSVIGRTITSADGTISGEVKSVLITSSGAQATLTDGRSVALGPGITIS